MGNVVQNGWVGGNEIGTDSNKLLISDGHLWNINEAKGNVKTPGEHSMTLNMLENDNDIMIVALTRVQYYWIIEFWTTAAHCARHRAAVQKNWCSLAHLSWMKVNMRLVGSQPPHAWIRCHVTEARRQQLPYRTSTVSSISGLCSFRQATCEQPQDISYNETPVLPLCSLHTWTASYSSHWRTLHLLSPCISSAGVSQQSMHS